MICIISRERGCFMNILDAQSKDTQRARTAVVGLLSRGAYIKAVYGRNGGNWRDFHLIIDGQRSEANLTALKGIAESGKATIVGGPEDGFVCFYADNLSMKGRFYV